MMLQSAVARLGVTFVHAINVKKWYFLQTIVFPVLIKLLRQEKGFCAKKLITYCLTLRPTCPCGCLISDTSLFKETSQQPLY